MPKKLYILLLLFFTPFLTTQALAADCTDITADDANTTISANCNDLDISGDDVEISKEYKESKYAKLHY